MYVHFHAKRGRYGQRGGDADASTSAIQETHAYFEVTCTLPGLQ